MCRIFLIIFLCYPLCIFAGVQEDMMVFFRQMGASVNTTQAGAYKDQSAGFYTGGSLFARNTVHNTNLASLRLPGYRAGCGGIDMHLGAFSFISADKLVEAIRAIGSSAASYGLLLALETFSPQIKNIVTELNDLAQKVNQANINSCEIAATTLGALWPKSDAANKHLCTMIGSDGTYGAFSDYAAARQGCGAGGKREEVLRAGKGRDKYQDMLGQEFNIAWRAIQANEFLRADKKLAEFFMSLSGTIVSISNAEGMRLEVKPSLAHKNSLLTALLQGGTTRVYTCLVPDEGNQCLNIGQEEVHVDSHNAFMDKVKDVLLALQNKIIEDQELTLSEKAFLNSTRLPFYKMLNVLTLYKKGEAPLDILEFSEIAAADILFNYINEILDVVEESTTHLRKGQIDDGPIKDFLKNLQDVRAQVNAKRMATFKHVEQIMSFIQKTELIEKMVTTKLNLLEAYE